MTPLDKKQLFRDMQEHPENYSDEQLEAMMADIDREPDAEAAWQRFKERTLSPLPRDGESLAGARKLRAATPFHNRRGRRWVFRVAASFTAVLFITGVAFAAIRWLAPLKTTEVPVLKEPEKKMLMAFRVPADCKNPIVKERGDGIVITWLKGTWIQGDDYSYIEERPVCQSPFMALTKLTKVMLNGKELDINNLPDLPASSLKKMEKHFNDGRWINLITTPVQIPADVEGNINPELTILLTGTSPKDSGAKTSIWFRWGTFDSFSWKNYSITSWTSQVDNIGNYLKDVAIRKDHHVRVNVCRSVSQKHIDRIKKLMQENGVTNYELVRQ